MRRYLLATVALALAIVAVVSLSVWYFERPVVVRVTVARDTPDHQLMTAVAAVMARERETLRLRVTAVDNASASRPAAARAPTPADPAHPPDAQRSYPH